VLLHKHFNLCSKFKVSGPSNRSQRHLVFLHSGSTLHMKGIIATTWKFSYFFFEFLEDFNYCLSLERLRHTRQKSYIRMLVWELVTWTKTNEFFLRQSKDQWRILFLQIDKIDGPQPPKHNFHSTPLAKESIRNTTCTKILNCTHCLHKVKNGSKGWTSTWSSEYHLLACCNTLYNAWQYVKQIGCRQPKFTLC